MYVTVFGKTEQLIKRKSILAYMTLMEVKNVDVHVTQRGSVRLASDPDGVIFTLRNGNNNKFH